MSEKIFPNKSMHQKILKTISTIENSSLEYIKHVDDIEISPKKDLWEYKFRFSDDGPKLTMWLRKDRFFVSSFISLKGKNEFSLVDYIRHISSREEAFRITGMFHKGEISGPKMFELKMEQLEELLSGELGEILRGEKWIDIPDYTMNDYR